jgi:hypothetical protein
MSLAIGPAVIHSCDHEVAEGCSPLMDIMEIQTDQKLVSSRFPPIMEFIFSKYRFLPSIKSVPKWFSNT